MIALTFYLQPYAAILFTFCMPFSTAEETSAGTFYSLFRPLFRKRSWEEDTTGFLPLLFAILRIGGCRHIQACCFFDVSVS